MEFGSDILNKLKDSSRELYSVPEGYFDAFPEQMLAKAKAEPAAKVILFSRHIFRYAAAAAIVGIIALGGWLWLGRSAETGTLSHADKVLMKKAQNISDSEIVAFIENNRAFPALEKNTVGEKIEENGMTLMLANVSDKELQQYLEQYGLDKTTLN